jgi:hypothetical protein
MGTSILRKINLHWADLSWVMKNSSNFRVSMSIAGNICYYFQTCNSLFSVIGSDSTSCKASIELVRACFESLQISVIHATRLDTEQIDKRHPAS